MTARLFLSTTTSFPMPQLSCEECSTRKTKCDKQAPCSACRSAGLRCHAIERARKPRGRSGKNRSQNTALESRVARLETLLQQATGASSDSDQAVTIPGAGQTAFQTEAGKVSEHVGQLSQYVAPSFWASLSNEVVLFKISRQRGAR